MNSTTLLGDVVLVSAGQPAPKANEFSSEGHPFIRAGSLERLLSGQCEKDCEKIDEATAQRRRLKLYPKDTVLFAKSGMSAKLGRIYRLRQPSYVVSHLAALAPIGKYDPAYLTYWLRSNPPSRLIKDDAYPSIRTSEIAQLHVPDIDINEQRRIAGILDKSEYIRQKHINILNLSKDFLSSVFNEIFGDLEVNPFDWDAVPLEEVLDVDPQNGLYRPSRDYGSGTSILRIDGFYDGYLANGKQLRRLRISEGTIYKYLLREGDIVINRVNSREYLGKSALIEGLNEETVYESNMMRFRVQEGRISPRFLVDQLQTPYIKRQILRASKDAVNQSSINQTDVRKLNIRLPPIHLQRRYVDIVNKNNASVKERRKAIEESDHLFRSLAQRAFRGEL